MKRNIDELSNTVETEILPCLSFSAKLSTIVKIWDGRKLLYNECSVGIAFKTIAFIYKCRDIGH